MPSSHDVERVRADAILAFFSESWPRTTQDRHHQAAAVAITGWKALKRTSRRLTPSSAWLCGRSCGVAWRCSSAICSRYCACRRFASVLGRCMAAENDQSLCAACIQSSLRGHDYLLERISRGASRQCPLTSTVQIAFMPRNCRGQELAPETAQPSRTVPERDWQTAFRAPESSGHHRTQRTHN